MKYLMETYASLDLKPVKGKGAYLTMDDGVQYLDFASGIATNSFGHCHPILVQALQKQAETLWHTTNLYHLPLAEALAEKLCNHSFADSAFFANSGLEAMEACIKMARRYHWSQGNPKRYRIITFKGAFHGRSLATIAAGNQAKHLEGFGPKVDGFDQIAPNDLTALKGCINEKTAAIMIEPIQGESGIHLQSKDWLQKLRALCDDHGLLLIFDEVQTGIGRTGTLFAYEQIGVSPDIMGLAKGLGGGFPIGAALATNAVAAAMKPGSHGSTFGGNPLATKVANTVLDLLLKEGFLSQVQDMGDWLKVQLENLQQQFPHIIKVIRAKGLMLGMACYEDYQQKLYQQLLLQRLLTVPAGDNVLRVFPPLNVTQEECKAALMMIQKACQNLSKK